MFWSMFAVLFVQLFSTTKFGMRLGPTANFKTYPDSLLAVYQMIVGDEWVCRTKFCFLSTCFFPLTFCSALTVCQNADDFDE